MNDRLLKWLGLGICLPLLMLVDLSSEPPLGLRFPREAHAIVGAPLTPASAAGVARRTTRRVVVVGSATTAAAVTSQQQATAQQQAATAQQQSATVQQQAAAAQKAQPARPATPSAAQAIGAPAVGTIVPVLPAGCVSAPKNGIEYHKCGSVYYRGAFQGSDLVFVVQQP